VTRKKEIHEVVQMLFDLDVQQRDKLLADIRRAALAQRIVAKAGRKAGALRGRVNPVEDHRIVKAFGTLPKAPTKKG
jgi:hypothetical protein